MIIRSTLSVLALYKYDNTLFDSMSLPEGVDKDVLVDNILMECAEYEILYPDAEFLKGAIASWSSMCMPTWQKLYDSTQFEYNPIWNKDGTYKETRNLGGSAINDTMGYNSSDWTNSDKTTTTDTGTVTRTEQGNIGITTTQEMIKQEREIADFNIIKRIVDDFRMRFCLLIY